MAVSAALAAVIAVPLAIGTGVVVTRVITDPASRPTAAVDAPRPVAVGPAPPVIVLPPPPPSAPRGGSPSSMPTSTTGPAPPSRTVLLPDVPIGRVRYDWPLHPAPVVLRPFRPGPWRWSPGHRGVDLATTSHAQIRAAAAGRVAFAGPLAGRPVVVVVHPDGIRTTYEPVDPMVRVGNEVAAGAVLGTLATSGSHCEAGCLHWGALRGAEYVDPIGLLVRWGPAVLLPMIGPLAG